MPSKDYTTVKIVFFVILIVAVTLGVLYSLILKEVWLSLVCTIVGAMGALISGVDTGRAVKEAKNNAEKRKYDAYRELCFSKVIHKSRSGSFMTVNFLAMSSMVKLLLMFQSKKSNSKPIKNKSEKQALSELYLVKVKLKLYKAKLITFGGILIAAAFNVFVDMGSMPLVVLLVYMFALESIERITAYRINRGYFGANRHEALQLLEFIHQNKDDDDITGGSRKPFKDIETTPDSESAIAVTGFAK
ncbi:hypothetical protein ACS0ON_004266 [Cronobacter dublinensis]